MSRGSLCSSEGLDLTGGVLRSSWYGLRGGFREARARGDGLVAHLVGRILLLRLRLQGDSSRADAVELLAAEDALHLVEIERLVLNQRFCERVQLVLMRLE